MIWRRFLIQNNSTLKDLHYVIQILMGWTDYHLNEFIIKGKRYTIPNAIGEPSSCGIDGSDIKLEEFSFRKNEKLLYRPRVEEDPKMLIWDFCILTV